MFPDTHLVKEAPGAHVRRAVKDEMAHIMGVLGKRAAPEFSAWPRVNSGGASVVAILRLRFLSVVCVGGGSKGDRLFSLKLPRTT